MAKITVVGSFVMDNVASMPRFPQAGETILGTSIAYYPGGKGINQCIAAARLGGEVEMCGMLGKDANGDTFRKIMQEDGVEQKHVYSCDKPTAIAQVQIDGNGQNRICVIPSANYEFGEEELNKIDETIKNTSLLILQLELRLDITLELIRRAHAYGVKVLLNPAPAVPLPDGVLGIVDYLTPNETELSILTGLPTDTEEEIYAAADCLLNKGVKTVIATLGKRGALIATKESKQIVAGFPVKAVDTVAAGDSFNGALAVAITEGKSLPEAVRFANAMGALTVQKQGAIPSLHTRAEVEAFLKNA